MTHTTPLEDMDDGRSSESGTDNPDSMQAELAEMEALIASRAQQARARAQMLASPSFFLDQDILPPWMCVLHGSAELYAQPFLEGQANGPRRFLGQLPAGAIFPHMLPVQQWRVCVVPSAFDCIAEFEWPRQTVELSEDASEADGEFDPASLDDASSAETSVAAERQTAALALGPLFEAVRSVAQNATSPCMVDLLVADDPLPLLQAWLQQSLAGISERRVPMPLEEIKGANLAARNSAMLKLATVLNPKARPKRIEDDSLAALAAEVARAQGLNLNKGAELGRSDESLIAWAQRAGVRLRRVALRDAWWQSSGVPLLACIPEAAEPDAAANAAQANPHAGFEHSTKAKVLANIVALVPEVQGGYRWRAQGQAFQTLDAETAANFASFAFSLHGRLPDRALHVGDLLSFGWRAALADVMLLLFASLLSGLLGAISPVAVAYVFQTVIPSSELSLLGHFTLLIASLALVSGAMHLSADLASLRIEGRLGNGLQSAMFDRLMRLPLRFYASLTSGDLANRIATIDIVRRSFANLFVMLVTSFCYTLGALATMSYYMPKAALFAFGVILLVWLVAGITGWRQVKTLYEGEQIEGNVIAMVVQLLQGITKLRLAGAEDRGFGLWGRGFSEMRTRLTRGRMMQVYLSAFIAIAEVALAATVFSVLGYSEGEKPTTSEFLALVAALAVFSTSGLSVGQSICRLILMKPFFERIRPILKAIPEAAPGGQEVARLNGGLEVVRLSFSYQVDGPPILQDVSFQVRSGQFVAIVGASGCGKSTLLRLLLGFESASSGSIYYDGRDLQALSAESVRRQIGVVLQNGRCMAGSLFENIAVAHDCTLEEAWTAARLAGLEDDIRAMPMGMHTILSEGNAALSGGQIQRLLLARALAGMPKILFLDEATSALDNRTQAWVTSSLAAMAMTRVVIAHRLSTVQKADLILVLHEGRIVERGTYEELMDLDRHFAALARRQLS